MKGQVDSFGRALIVVSVRLSDVALPKASVCP